MAFIRTGRALAPHSKAGSAPTIVNLKFLQSGFEFRPNTTGPAASSSRTDPVHGRRVRNVLGSPATSLSLPPALEASSPPMCYTHTATRQTITVLPLLTHIYLAGSLCFQAALGAPWSESPASSTPHPPNYEQPMVARFDCSALVARAPLFTGHTCLACGETRNPTYPPCSNQNLPPLLFTGWAHRPPREEHRHLDHGHQQQLCKTPRTRRQLGAGPAGRARARRFGAGGYSDRPHAEGAGHAGADVPPHPGPETGRLLQEDRGGGHTARGTGDACGDAGERTQQQSVS